MYMEIPAELKTRLIKNAEDDVEYWKAKFREDTTKESMYYWVLASDTLKNLTE